MADTAYSSRFKFSQEPTLNGQPEPVPVDIRKIADGTFGVFFRLLEQGSYSCFLAVQGHPIKGSPLTVQAFPEVASLYAMLCRTQRCLPAHNPRCTLNRSRADSVMTVFAFRRISIRMDPTATSNGSL